MTSIEKMINDGVGVIIGFFIFGMLLSALLYPMAASYQNIVFTNVSLTPNVTLGETVGFYINAHGAIGGNVPIPYFVYVIMSNMVLFASLALLLIILAAILVYIKFKK